jgi:hypothetical protein
MLAKISLIILIGVSLFLIVYCIVTDDGEIIEF